MPINLGAPSLYDVCKRFLIRRIEAIDDVGEVEYPVIEPVLRKVSSPLQLEKIEKNSPHIAAEDSELWKKFIARDFGEDVLKQLPDDAGEKKGWSRVYRKCQREKAAADELAAEALKAKFNALSSQKHGHKTQLLPASALPPQRRFKPSGAAGTSNWGKSADNWSVKAGSKTKNAVAKAKREVREMSYFRSEKSRLGVPMHALRAGPVGQGLKEKERKAAEVRAPAKGESSGGGGGGADEARSAKRERDEDADGEDGLFGDEDGGGGGGGEKEVKESRAERDRRLRREAWLTQRKATASSSSSSAPAPATGSSQSSPPAPRRPAASANPFMPPKKKPKADPFMPKAKPRAGAR